MSATKRQYGAASPALADIVTAALAIIDRDGVDGLTVRRLATALGSYPANLYRRFKSVEELLTHVTLRVFEQLGGPPSLTMEPSEALLDFAVRSRDGWLAHPHAISLLFYDQHPDVAALLERVLALFSTLGGDDTAFLDGAYQYVTVLYGAIFAGSAQASRAPTLTAAPNPSPLPHTLRMATLLTQRSAGSYEFAGLTDPHFRFAITRAIERASNSGEAQNLNRRHPS